MTILADVQIPIPAQLGIAGVLLAILIFIVQWMMKMISELRMENKELYNKLFDTIPVTAAQNEVTKDMIGLLHEFKDDRDDELRALREQRRKAGA